MFKNLRIFRIAKLMQLSAESLASKLSTVQFLECGTSDNQSMGWISPCGDDRLVHTVNGNFLLSFRTEKKLLPACVVKKFAREKAKSIAEEQGFAPGRKAMKEIKERVIDELLPKAFTMDKNTNVWIDPRNGWFVIDTSSSTKADEILKYFLKAVGSFQIENFSVKDTPSEIMTYWLHSDQGDYNFTIDQDVELTAQNESKSKLRLSKESMDPDDAKKHIRAGKVCTKVALTWKDKISFILHSSLQITQVKPLDVLDDKSASDKDAQERFDSDFAMMAGELNLLFKDLADAFGGESDLAKAA